MLLFVTQPDRTSDHRLERDLRTLIRFVEIFCHDHHCHDSALPVVTKVVDITELAGHPIELCSDCRKLLAHALVKRFTCPMDPKPACKHCPNHCYHPTYRHRIQQVMKYSGRKLATRGRLDYLLHLLF